MAGFETARFTVTYVSYRGTWAAAHCVPRTTDLALVFIEETHLTAYFLCSCLINLLQSRNCDGGVQEFSAAARCIRDIFPDAEIVPVRTNAYPLKVVIEVDSLEQSKKLIVWSGEQQNLFEINGRKRSKCMQRIKSKLTVLREQPSGVAAM